MTRMLLAALISLTLHGATITANYSALPDGCSASIAVAGTTVTGSSAVCAGGLGGNRGIGIFGGGNNASLDLSESMSIDFGMLVTGVTLRVWDVDPPGNVTFGFTAFNGVSNLGTFAIPSLTVNPTTFDLTTIAGQNFSRFVLNSSVSAPIGLQIQQVSYESAAVPEPSTLALLSAGALLVFVRRKRNG